MNKQPKKANSKLSKATENAQILIPTWQNVTLKFNKYSNITATLFEHYVIFFGEVSSTKGRKGKDIDIYDIHRNKCDTVRVVGDAFVHRAMHSACMYQENKIIIFGGRIPRTSFDGTDEVLMLVLEEQDNLRIEWKLLKCKSEQDIARYNHQAHIYQDRMYVFGGNTIKGESNELWCLDLDSRQWTLKHPSGKAPAKRSAYASALVNNKIYIFGGAKGRNMLADIWMVDLENMQWHSLAQDYALGKFACGSAEVINGNIYIFGGLAGTEGFDTRSNDLYVYSTEEGTIKILPTQGETPAGRCSHASVSYKNTLFIFGGMISYGPDGQKPRPRLAFSIELPESCEPNTSTEVGKCVTDPAHRKNLFNSKVDSDITFDIQGHELKAHKSILAEQCKFFANMFSSGMSETNASKIHIQDVELSTFEALLEFIYCNEVDLHLELAVDLLKLSDKYLFVELQNMCEKYLAKNITLDNLVELAQITDQLNVTKLKEALVKFLTRNMKKIQMNGIADTLPRSLLIEAICYLTAK